MKMIRNEETYIRVPKGPFHDTYECPNCGDMDMPDSYGNNESCPNCGSTMINND